MNILFENLDSLKKKSFDIGWVRTRVPTIASSQRWPLGHSAFKIEKINQTV